MGATHRQPARVQDLWFSDGNIVIEAGHKQFCVYRGLLAACSSVFEDMFGIPQPPGSETYENTSIAFLRMEDDPEELECFLKLSFGSRFALNRELSCHESCAMLELSRKYDAPEIRVFVVEALKKRFPTTLVALDSPALRMHPASAMRVANVADIEDLPSLLPFALMQSCSVRSPADLVTGIPDPNHNGEIVRLSPRYLAVCVAARQSFLGWERDEVCGWLQFLGECTDRDCVAARMRAFSDFFDDSVCKPLEMTFFWDELRSDGVCGDCVEGAEGVHEVYRRQCWWSLPATFGLGTWESLGVDSKALW